MPWYYASPDGQPVGPLSQEELIAKRGRGEISPETYILEQGGIGAPAWRHYKDVFPVNALPTVPAAETLATTPQAAPPAVHHPILVKTNNWAVIGAIVGLMSLMLAPLCCIGTVLSLPGLLFSGLGYYEIQRNEPYETGKGVAIFGLVTSGLSLLLLIVVIVWGFSAQKDFTTSLQHLQHLQSTPSYH